MSQLEDELRFAREGKVSGITLWPITLDEKPQWQANVKRGNGWIVRHNEDPVVALIEALTQGQAKRIKTVPAPAFVTAEPEAKVSVFD